MVLATLPVIAGVRHSGDFFDLVFFAVLVSTVLQGTTVEWLAGRLGLDERAAAQRSPPSPSESPDGAGATGGVTGSGDV